MTNLTDEQLEKCREAFNKWAAHYGHDLHWDKKYQWHSDPTTRAEWKAWQAAWSAAQANEAKPIDMWHEELGDVMWWKFPLQEPPYVGSPLCDSWPGYHTHFTALPTPPTQPSGGKGGE